MKRIVVTCIAIFFVLSGCNKTTETVSDLSLRQQVMFTKWEVVPYFIPKDISLVALGDSLTEGVGDEKNKGGYVGRLTEKMTDWKGVRKIDLENLAKRGKRSDQLLEQVKQDTYVKSALMGADIIVLTIGGNDMMKIVKRDLFNLTKEPFYVELVNYEQRMAETFHEIRLSNAHAPIVVLGLYNPFIMFTGDVEDLQTIIGDWNSVIKGIAADDGNACFVPVEDLFVSNDHMVYHKDFFHPNGYGYQLMTDRIVESLKQCGLYELTDGEMDF